MNKKILVCDDTMFMRNMLREILTENGYEVVGEAENGRIAVEKHKQLKPDLTLMDITMPELDGVNALIGIIENDANANVIMCSAMGQEDVVVSAIKAGAKDFIVKPFRNERVIEAVRRTIGE
ncbi:MAG: response regulator [Clostridium butyricum]|nr:response regulator [Clostridium butyricum]